MTLSAAVWDRLHASGEADPIRRTGVDVGAWLHGLGLGQYEQAFRDNDIDAEVLPELTAEDLVGLGMASIGHRRNLPFGRHGRDRRRQDRPFSARRDRPLQAHEVTTTSSCKGPDAIEVDAGRSYLIRWTIDT
jgi:hypothetical protein